MQPTQEILKDQATASLRRVYFDAEDAATPGTPLSATEMDIGTTGAFTVKRSKNGGASATPTGSTITEVSAADLKGLFYVELAAADVDTGGILAIYVKSAGGPANMVPRCVLIRIRSIDDQDGVRAGLTALPNAAAEAAGGLFTRGSGAGQINQAANGQVDTKVVSMAAGTVTAAAVATGAIDADALASDAVAEIIAGVVSAESPAAQGGALIQYNETVAAKRRVDIEIRQDDGTPPPPLTDFVALGAVWVPSDDPDVTDFQLATGTITNKKRPLSMVTPAITATDTGLEQVTCVGHGLLTGDSFIRPSSTTGGVDSATDYYAIKVDDDTFAIADSLAHALAGTRVNITGSLNTLTFTADAVNFGSERYVPRVYTYQFTQAETVRDLPALFVLVDGPGYAKENNGGGFAIATLSSTASDTGTAILEGSLTRDDALRVILRTAAARCSKVGDDFVWRDMANSKDSHSGTVTTSGRTAAAIIDAT